jgi:hypothetical protein
MKQREDKPMNNMTFCYALAHFVLFVKIMHRDVSGTDFDDMNNYVYYDVSVL